MYTDFTLKALQHTRWCSPGKPVLKAPQLVESNSTQTQCANISLLEEAMTLSMTFPSGAEQDLDMVRQHCVEVYEGVTVQ